MGAWIEIPHPRSRFIPVGVAPLVGAWIEISTTPFNSAGGYVAPLVGAWIEITLLIIRYGLRMSLPSWERGLKYSIHDQDLFQSASLPSWERGLKLRTGTENTLNAIVAPLVGAWIEISPLVISICPGLGRSPRGSVD